MARKDNRTLAALSGLAILLVVVGHSALPAEAGARLASSDPAYAAFELFVRWLYTFHGKLLHAVAGFLLLRATLRMGARPYPPFGPFMLGKAKRLLVPYVVISSLAYPVKAVLSRHAIHPVGLSVTEYLASLVLPWNNAIVFFWFLPTLLVQFALARLALRARSSHLYDLGILIASALIWSVCAHENRSGLAAILNVGGALHNFVFFAAGFLACKYELLERVRTFSPVGPVALALSLVGFVWFLQVPYVALLLGFVGMALSLAVVSTPAGSWLAEVGDVSYDIYLFSWFPQVVVRVLIVQILGVNIWFSIVLSVAAAIAVPLAVIAVRRRVVSARMAYLFGGPFEDRELGPTAARAGAQFAPRSPTSG